MSLTGLEAVLTEDELREWGEAFGRALSAPCVITLRGDLGAGKTTLAQAICRGYGVTEHVTSPTYAIRQVYAAPASPVNHVDLYRLEDTRELLQLGWDELLAEHAVTLVEWPERAGDLLPAERLDLELTGVPSDPGRRRLRAR